jgi:hypothetical protein
VAATSANATPPSPSSAAVAIIVMEISFLSTVLLLLQQ